MSGLTRDPRGVGAGVCTGAMRMENGSLVEAPGVLVLLLPALYTAAKFCNPWASGHVDGTVCRRGPVENAFPGVSVSLKTEHLCPTHQVSLMPNGKH